MSTTGRKKNADSAERITARGGFRKVLDTPPAAPAQVDCRPEWCRPGQVPQLFGLSRTYIYGLLAAGEITGVNLRQPGKATGCRLLSCQSIRDFLARAAANPVES
jgi:hypothetical protein